MVSASFPEIASCITANNQINQLPSLYKKFIMVRNNCVLAVLRIIEVNGDKHLLRKDGISQKTG